MADKRRRKRPLKQRKLEIAVYAVMVLIAAGILFLVVSLINNDTASDNPASSAQSDAAITEQPGLNTDDSADNNESDVSAGSSTDGSDAEMSSSAQNASSNVSSDSKETSSSESVDISSAPGNKSDYIDYTVTGAKEADMWYLHIASLENPMPDEWRPTDLEVIDSEGRRIDSRVYEAYKDLTNAAKEAGISIWPISAYRSYDTQNTLFTNRIQRVLNENPGFTYEQATAEAARHVAPPNTSDHELGLAVDFNSVEESFENTSAGRWLAENCNKYGFVLRYPKDKQAITGVTYEPWHFRFVGVKHANKMTELNMCLEEYVEYVRESE